MATTNRYSRIGSENATPACPAAPWKTSTVAPVVLKKLSTTAIISTSGASRLRSSSARMTAINPPATGKITDRSRLLASRMSA